MNRNHYLPIDRLLPLISESLAKHSSLVLEAAPGAGKTTRVPATLLNIVAGEVIVLEPRRIAARMAARRVAWELGEQVGDTVGYQVRFEEVVGPKTRLRFMTEGVLLRRLLSDPELKGVDAVVLDEFHERHLESDLALALLKRLQQRRRDLILVVMSATLDSAVVAKYLSECPVLQVEGRSFPLAIRHMGYSSELLQKQVCNAVATLMTEGSTGDVLIFLPGIAEIRRSMRECEAVALRYDLTMLPLHGDLSPAEQDAVVAPSLKRKLILTTNIAESSVTLEGVTAVIDSGLARFASYSQWTGMPTLHVGRVSQASAKQRAGRAGRTGPGQVLRLYSEEDYLRRPEHETPEMMRSDLSQLCLTLRAMGIAEAQTFEWLDAPPDVALQHAEMLLDRLGAVDGMARRMARYPLSPRLSKMLLDAAERSVGEDACIAAALLSSGTRIEQSDLLEAIEAPLDRNLSRHVDQLRRIARSSKQGTHDDDALLLSVLAGFPDRVAKRRAGNQVLMSNGTSAELSGQVPAYAFMVAVDAEDRKERALPLIRMTARIEPEWLIDLFPERVRERSEVQWNEATQRVEAVSELLYDELVLQSSRDAQPDEKAASEMLARKALEAGIERFVDGEALEALLARVDFAGLDAPNIEETLSEVCGGLRSFAELKRVSANFIPLLEQKMEAHHLRDLAPTSLRLQGGRQTRIHYERGKPPWIASRLQDFFGMRETPVIGKSKTPVVIHLLAPNQRAVQTTTDLAGFWERLYPQVRRELMRRYPRHAWPERP